MTLRTVSIDGKKYENVCGFEVRVLDGYNIGDTKRTMVDLTIYLGNDNLIGVNHQKKVVETKWAGDFPISLVRDFDVHRLRLEIEAKETAYIVES